MADDSISIFDRDVFYDENTDRYILDEHGDPQRCPDLLKWARWFEHPGRRRVAETFLTDGTWVSTIFLGIDHSHLRFFGLRHPHVPILFETMVFPHPDAKRDEGRGEDIDQDRYSTWDEAEKGHVEMVARWEGHLGQTYERLKELAAMPSMKLLAAVPAEESKTPEPQDVK